MRNIEFGSKPAYFAISAMNAVYPYIECAADTVKPQYCFTVLPRIRHSERTAIYSGWVFTRHKRGIDRKQIPHIRVMHLPVSLHLPA